jgi:hypothetical protein
LDESNISNRRIKSDIRMDEDPQYQYKCPVYKNYKTSKRSLRFNNKENQPMVFGNHNSNSYDNLEKYNEYKKAKANRLPNKNKANEHRIHEHQSISKIVEP